MFEQHLVLSFNFRLVKIIMITTYVSTWICPYFGLVDAGFESSRQQEEVDQSIW